MMDYLLLLQGVQLKPILLDCGSNGVILIQPLNQKAILVASCKDATVLNELDTSSIQMHFSAQHNHLVAS